MSTRATLRAKRGRVPGSPAQRVGFAIVGLRHLARGQILPAFGKTDEYCRAAALLSGDWNKAGMITARYEIKESSIYDYMSFEDITGNPDVQVIYIDLPNSMHAENVLRGSQFGKHILCEKPMANSSADCEPRIARSVTTVSCSAGALCRMGFT